jgi:hypothetical protein
MVEHIAPLHKLASLYYRLMEWLMPSDFCLVDTAENFVLGTGTVPKVEHEMEVWQSSGYDAKNLMIVRKHDLPEDCDLNDIEDSEEVWGLSWLAMDGDTAASDEDVCK